MTSMKTPGLAACFGLAVASAPAQAITCSFTTVVPVSFGAYDVFDTGAVDAAGSLGVTCPGAMPTDTIIITLSAGDAGTWAPRAMTGAGATDLAYNLYRDAARTIVWGDGTSGSSSYGPVSAPLTGEHTVSVYGRVPALQDVQAGGYTDTVVATVHF